MKLLRQISILTLLFNISNANNFNYSSPQSFNNEILNSESKNKSMLHNKERMLQMKNMQNHYKSLKTLQNARDNVKLEGVLDSFSKSTSAEIESAVSKINNLPYYYKDIDNLSIDENFDNSELLADEKYFANKIPSRKAMPKPRNNNSVPKNVVKTPSLLNHMKILKTVKYKGNYFANVKLGNDTVLLKDGDILGNIKIIKIDEQGMAVLSRGIVKYLPLLR